MDVEEKLKIHLTINQRYLFCFTNILNWPVYEVSSKEFTSTPAKAIINKFKA